ncbi:MAG: RNA methyltransferase [Firmicutes bacterium]|nr:RNA methyltransferase [Bacillota bacterium]
MLIINSLTNEVVLKYKKLKDKKYREKASQYLIEGLRFVSDAVNSLQSIEIIFVDSEKAPKYRDLLEKTNCKIYYLEQKVLNVLSDTVTSQGIVAVINIKHKGVFSGQSNCLILDNIKDPGNLGTIIRTAAAFKFFDIFLVDCVDAYNPKVLRSTMGGIFFVNLYEYPAEKTISFLKGNYYKIYAADVNGEDFESINANPKMALAIGSEAFGISKEILDNSYKTIAIKMEKTVESLNAAVSAAILMNRFKI